MPDITTNSDAALRASARPKRADLRWILWFSALVVIGGVATQYPVFLLGCLGAAAAVGIYWFIAVQLRRAGVEIWQLMALTAVSGYMVLNYGFENLTIHAGGFPIIISYLLMYGALILAIAPRMNFLVTAIKEPPVLCAAALLFLAFFHLAVEVPTYGLWALRDSSMCLDSMFMLLGLLWATRSNSLVVVPRWLMVIFSVNMIYGLTLPLGDKIYDWSPKSGVFIEVPILGNYAGTGDALMVGALFCVCVGSFVIKRPKWLVTVLVLGQLLGVAIAQVRRMYLGAVAVVLILILAGEIKKFGKLLILLPASLAAILLVTTIGGIEITGRVGPVNLDFFRDHIRSMSGEDVEDTPGSSVHSRIVMLDEAMDHFYAHPVVGEGFGKPLFNEVEPQSGAVSRQAHNTSITYLARLGLVGFILWIAFHGMLITRFLHAFRQRHSADPLVYSFVLWFFLYYVLFMMASMVEPAFEFPSGAVPFYFLLGFALGLIRWRLSGKSQGDSASLTLQEQGA